MHLLMTAAAAKHAELPVLAAAAWRGVCGRAIELDPLLLLLLLLLLLRLRSPRGRPAGLRLRPLLLLLLLSRQRGRPAVLRRRAQGCEGALQARELLRLSPKTKGCRESTHMSTVCVPLFLFQCTLADDQPCH